MPLIRMIIREAIIKLLQESLNGFNIKTEPHVPVTLHDLPLITIKLDKANTLVEWSALDGKGNLLEMVEQSVIMKIADASSQQLEVKLEKLAEKIIQNLTQNSLQGGFIKVLRIENNDIDVSISFEGEQPIGTLCYTLIVLYRHINNQLVQVGN